MDQFLLKGPPPRAGDTSTISVTTTDAPEKFDWSTDDSVVIQEQLAIAIYRNRHDAIVIRQEGVGDDEDHFVIFRDVDAVRIVVAALQAEIRGGRS